MTDTPAEVEAARALVAAYDALNSPEHQQEAERLRELSLRVSSRVDAFQAAQDRIHGLHAAACANGTPAADNAAAAHVIDPKADPDLDDMPESYADDDELFGVNALPNEEDEYQTARANGAYSDN